MIGAMEVRDLESVSICHTLKSVTDGIVGTVSNVDAAVACWSIYDGYRSCMTMAISAETYLDLKRRGQASFAKLSNTLERTPHVETEDFDGLSLAESAPMSQEVTEFISTRNARRASGAASL
jgi:hypothetical protein